MFLHGDNCYLMSRKYWSAIDKIIVRDFSYLLFREKTQMFRTLFRSTWVSLKNPQNGLVSFSEAVFALSTERKYVGVSFTHVGRTVLSFQVFIFRPTSTGVEYRKLMIKKVVVVLAFDGGG